MKYISTRGKAPSLNFEDVLLTGLASDGGLYVPESLPFYSPEEITSWIGLPYNELAYKIIAPFVNGEIPEKELKAIIDETYANFDHTAVAPVKQLGHNKWLLELFHGPTLAFKDFALQLLGRLLDHFLQKRDEKVVILGATSGDTGSAAIYGCKRCENIDIFILHPHNRVSEVQRKQMTSVLSGNIHNIAIEGNFDDCQDMVKQCFGNQEFLEGKRRLVAVNSINWARIMAQVVYYFSSALSLGAPMRQISFSVPTGNFGDIFAGYLARKMGLPIKQLIVATNQNDILHRSFHDNDYSKGELKHSLSPSMDIMVSSNFERLLFDLYDKDGDAIADLMDKFAATGKLEIEPHRLEKAKAVFSSYAANDDVTVETIANMYKETGEVLDPHTAIGVKAAEECNVDENTPMVILATAHPAKFAEAILKSGIKEEPKLPEHLSDLLSREEKYSVLDNDIAKVQEFITKNI